MRRIARVVTWVAGVSLACLAGTLPACGTMGGGGMKYLVDPPGIVADSA